MKKIVLELPLVGLVDVLIKDDLAEYVKRQFLNYFVSEERASCIKKEYISSLIFYSEELLKLFTKYREQKVSLSSNEYWDGNKITINEYEYILYEDFVKINVIKKIGVKAVIKDLMVLMRSRTEEMKYAFLGGKFYQSVLFPILSMYAAGYGLYTVHGSLIHLKSGDNLIISGLNGVGKSTLSDLICSEEDNALLADNIVLYNGRKGLNLNLAMRLESAIDTEQKVIYANKEIKEVVPEERNMGLVNVDKIIVLLKGMGTDIVHYTTAIPMTDWVVFVERAPEIGQANSVLSYWLFMHTVFYGKTKPDVDIQTLSIPKGKLVEAKELLLNELKIFSR